MSAPRISVVIPTLNAETRISEQLDILHSQTVMPDEILVVDSESTDNTVNIAKQYPLVSIKEVKRSTFNHGLTRHEALLDTKGDFVCFLTDDAIPANQEFIENILKPFSDDMIALVSGRQLPKSDARRYEQLVREYNYGDENNIRTSVDIDRLGIKAFFATDACSMYRRVPYLKVGGFERVNTNEDMLIASRFLHAGYKVGYEADACVFHSHNLTFNQQFKRNREVGRFLELFSADLDCGSEVGEGASLARMVSRQLLIEHNISEFCAFGLDCVARLLGNRCGRHDVKKQKGDKA